MQRVCVHANTHGIARSASSSRGRPRSGRETGREPISSRPSSSSGVNDRRKRGKLRVVPDDRAVRGVRGARDRVDRLARAGRRLGEAARQRGQQRRGDRRLEVSPREARAGRT